MSRITVVLVLASAILATACGGSGGGGTIKSGLSAAFIADEPAPGADTVAMAEGAATNNLVTVDVTVTDTNGVYAADFDVLFDPNSATYEGWSPGTLLEQGGHAPIYGVGTPVDGRLVVVATRQGDVGGADAAGTVPVIRLIFSVTEVGQSLMSFQANSLLDSQPQPQPIGGIDWYAGSLEGI
jgi:hypothetical protein